MNRYILGGVVVMVGLAAAFMATQKKEVVEGGSVKIGVLLGFTGPIEKILVASSQQHCRHCLGWIALVELDLTPEGDRGRQSPWSHSEWADGCRVPRQQISPLHTGEQISY